MCIFYTALYWKENGKTAKYYENAENSKVNIVILLEALELLKYFLMGENNNNKKKKREKRR